MNRLIEVVENIVIEDYKVMMNAKRVQNKKLVKASDFGGPSYKEAESLWRHSCYILAQMESHINRGE